MKIKKRLINNQKKILFNIMNLNYSNIILKTPINKIFNI